MQRQVWCNFLILFLYFQILFRWEKDDLCYVAVVCTQYLITSLASPVVNVISLISLPLVPCFYNLRKQGHKVVAVQKIVIKLFHIYLWSCLLLKKLTQNIRWYFCDIVSDDCCLLPIVTSSSWFELFLWLLKCSVSLLEIISIRWPPHLIPLIQHEPFLIHHFYLIFPFARKWKLSLSLSDSSISLLSV